MTKTSPSVVCIGAGPAGLTAAYLLSKQGIAATVVEQDPVYVGGISRTARYKGFSFDIGGHRFFSKSAEVNALWSELLSEDFLDRHIQRFGLQALEVRLRIVQTVDVVDPQAVDHAALDQLEDEPVRAVEHCGLVHPQRCKVVDVEEAPVVDFIDRHAPVRQSIRLCIQQGIERVEAARLTGCAIEPRHRGFDGGPCRREVAGMAGHASFADEGAWSEQSEMEHDYEQEMMPNMKDPKVIKGLSRVGESAVRIRSGRLQ